MCWEREEGRARKLMTRRLGEKGAEGSRGKGGTEKEGKKEQGNMGHIIKAKVNFCGHWAEMYLELCGAAGLLSLMKGRPSIVEVIANNFLPFTQNFHGIVCMAAS